MKDQTVVQLPPTALHPTVAEKFVGDNAGNPNTLVTGTVPTMPAPPAADYVDALPARPNGGRP